MSNKTDVRSDESLARRHFLRQVALGAIVGSAGLTITKEALAASIKYASWVHGSSIQVQYPDRINGIERKGDCAVIYAKWSESLENWFHFAIPTPVIASGSRLRVQSVGLKFRIGEKAWLEKVRIFDGPKVIASYDGLKLTGNQGLGFSDGFKKFSVPNTPSVYWGIGISVSVKNTGALEPQPIHAWDIEFGAAGADFI